MTYTKEQLIVTKRILENLISDERELFCDRMGICGNIWKHKLNDKYEVNKVCWFFKKIKLIGVHIPHIDCIDLVDKFSLGWEHRDSSPTYPVPDVKGCDKWQGENLQLRISLMKHIIGKIDKMLGEL